MTILNKATLKTFFEQNDVPQGSDYGNFIDSGVNLAETGLQTMAGSLQTTEIVASRVSAGNGNFTGTLNVANLSIDSLAVSAFAAVGVSAIHFNMQEGTFSPPVTIAASGTTLGTANLLTTARITILISATDSTATGIGLLANKTGLEQYVYNDTAVSANLWPCAGGQINNLSSGAAFGMTSKTQYTVLHTKASGYAVK